MEEYKGIYYGDDNEQMFYEGGAHFDYQLLYKALVKLKQDIEKKKLVENYEKRKQQRKKAKPNNQSLLMQKENDNIKSYQNFLVSFQNEKPIIEEDKIQLKDIEKDSTITKDNTITLSNNRRERPIKKKNKVRIIIF